MVVSETASSLTPTAIRAPLSPPILCKHSRTLPLLVLPPLRCPRLDLVALGAARKVVRLPRQYSDSPAAASPLQDPASRSIESSGRVNLTNERPDADPDLSVDLGKLPLEGGRFWTEAACGNCNIFAVA